MGLVVMKRIKDLSKLLSHSLPKILIFTHCNKDSTGKYSQLITHGPSTLSCPLVYTPNTKPYGCNAIQVCTQLNFSSLLSFLKSAQVVSAIPLQIEFWIYSVFYSRHPPGPSLFTLNRSAFMILETVQMEVGVKRFFSDPTALQILY